MQWLDATPQPGDDPLPDNGSEWSSHLSKGIIHKNTGGRFELIYIYSASLQNVIYKSQTFLQQCTQASRHLLFHLIPWDMLLQPHLTGETVVAWRWAQPPKAPRFYCSSGDHVPPTNSLHQMVLTAPITLGDTQMPSPKKVPGFCPSLYDSADKFSCRVSCLGSNMAVPTNTSVTLCTLLNLF